MIVLIGRASNIKLKRTWQPVTWLAYATQAPERPRRLTWCYVPPYVVLLLVLIASPNVVLAERGQFRGYRYLMFSDPIVVRFDDGTELKISVIALASKFRDTLALTVNDLVVDKGYLEVRKRRLTLRHEDGGSKLRVICTPVSAADSTVNHTCGVKIDGKQVGRLKVDKRLYPQDGTANAKQAPERPRHLTWCYVARSAYERR